jgi:hypothetical protein
MASPGRSLCMSASHMRAEPCQRLAKGDVITYRLTAAHLPTDPLREWHGRVESIHADAVIVTILDEGYAGQREVVGWVQILSGTNEPAGAQTQERTIPA